jgi:hypothetical protein
MPLKHLARLLTILALLLAPAGMLSGHAAMAAPASSAAEGHCSEMAGTHDETSDQTAPGSSIECMIACACVPPLGIQLTGAPPVVESAEVVGLSKFVVGVNPSADPPPPRRS